MSPGDELMSAGGVVVVVVVGCSWNVTGTL